MVGGITDSAAGKSMLGREMRRGSERGEERASGKAADWYNGQSHSKGRGCTPGQEGGSIQRVPRGERSRLKNWVMWKLCGRGAGKGRGGGLGGVLPQFERDDACSQTWGFFIGCCCLRKVKYFYNIKI